MLLRERWEQTEREILASQATLAAESKGRRIDEPECAMRTCFQRDRDRILHSKAFRRLKHKTHVFIAPQGDHYRTRLTHTLEVAQIARTIARALRLNEDLVEATALGHDLGHTPFGHTGEAVLDKLHPGGFKHYLHSLRVVDFLESKPGRDGLNLTWEVRDGIANHSGENRAHTLEGKIIKFSDRIAYINHDIDDSIRAGVLHMEDIPSALLETLGRSHSARISTMVQSVVENSADYRDIRMDETVGGAMNRLRDFMFEHIYYSKIVKSEEEKVEMLIRDLYGYYKKRPEKLPKEVLAFAARREVAEDDMITDYIAGMTDRFAIAVWRDLFEPKDWHSL